MQVYNDCQRVVYKMHPGNSYTVENGSHTMTGGLHQVTGRDGRGKMPEDVVSNGRGQGDSVWIIDSCSGPEDNSTDPHESLTETSTLTFADAHTIDGSGESHSLQGLGVGIVYTKEFVLIDDDDDGDMSLREKTVTDMSVMDGNAADLVCGRLLSVSSGSLSESKQESPAPEARPPEEADTSAKVRRCCLCTIL